MAKANLGAGLCSLRLSLRRIKDILAWRDLKRFEQEPDQPPAFRFNDSTESDLRNEYSFFLFTCLQIQTALNESSLAITAEQREQTKRQLLNLENQLHKLGLQQEAR